MLSLCVALLFVSSAIARSSPGADYVQRVYGQGVSRLSDNVTVDALLDVPDLITKYGYPVEVHNVETEDGYILEMHRIPHGRDENNSTGQKPVVFLMHGIVLSSADWVMMGPGTSFGYMLAENGYDVWMGNARGNYYSRNHTTMDPDRSPFWDFSWHEIGVNDLTAMIDYALAVSGEEKLHYVGHSQGTTTFFVMASARPEYNAKIKSMHAYAPVVYMAYNENLLIRLISLFSRQLETIVSALGLSEWVPASDVTSRIGALLCDDGSLIQPICTTVAFAIGGYSPDQWNATMLPVILGHAPAGTSAKQFAHYGQSITDKKFRQYDFGILLNLIKYGSLSPPEYALSSVTAPVFLHYCTGDPLSEVEDVEQLYEELGGIKEKILVPSEYYSHLDYIWGIDSKTVLYTPTIDIMKEYD